jgi:Mor family transcriptional regulator
MGNEAAGKFCRIYAGENVFIPKCGGARRVLRDAEICRAHAAGASYSAISRRFDLTERQIGDILRRGRGRQP